MASPERFEVPVSHLTTILPEEVIVVLYRVVGWVGSAADQFSVIRWGRPSFGKIVVRWETGTSNLSKYVQCILYKRPPLDYTR